MEQELLNQEILNKLEIIADGIKFIEFFIVIFFLYGCFKFLWSWWGSYFL